MEHSPPESIVDPARPARSRAATVVVSLILLFGFLISVLHPIGDAPDEQENLRYIQHVAKTWTKPRPEDHIRQNMHPPLAFVMAALASVPLEKITNILPREAVWPFWLEVKIPLNQPSTYVMRDHNYTVRDGPPEFRAFTLLGIRLLSTIYVAIAAWLAIRAANLLMPGWPRLCAATVGFLLLTPGAILQTGAIGMEAPLLMFGAWGAYEMARGLRSDYKYSPLRVGVALALAGLCRHAGFTLIVGALAVAAVRAPRIGRRKAILELCIAGFVASCGLGSWILHNYITTGDPLVLYVNVAHFPEVFRTTPPTVESQDAWLPNIFSDYFGPHADGVQPSRTLEFLFFILLGATFIPGVFVHLTKTDEGGVPVRARLCFGLLVLAAVAIIPFSGNIHYYQMHGRYLLPAVPFVAPIVAAGARVTFQAARDSAGYLLCFALSPFATITTLLFALGPLFHPFTTPRKGAVAYADCGGPVDPYLTRGTPVRIAGDTLYPLPTNSYAIDLESVEYTLPVEGDPNGLWLHLTIPGISESSIHFMSVDYVFLSARVRIDGKIAADWISPMIRPTSWAYPIPPEAVRNNKLIVSIDRVPRLSVILVSEIRLDRKGPESLETRGRKIRISAADAREGVGERLGASYASSNFVRHIPIGEKPNSIVCQTPRVPFAPGRYLLRTRAAIVKGTHGDQAGLLIAGDTTEALVKLAPLVVDEKKLTNMLSEVSLEFTVPPGPPVELTCRIEASGKAVLDVDDIEVFGPLSENEK